MDSTFAAPWLFLPPQNEYESPLFQPCQGYAPATPFPLLRKIVSASPRPRSELTAPPSALYDVRLPGAMQSTSESSAGSAQL